MKANGNNKAMTVNIPENAVKTLTVEKNVPSSKEIFIFYFF